MAQVGVAAGSADADGGGERRVHGDDGGAQAGKTIGKGFGVVCGDGSRRKEIAEKGVPVLRDLVEVEDGSGGRVGGNGGHAGEDAGAGGGLQEGVAMTDRKCGKGDIGQRQRGRELLQADLVLGPAGVGGFEPGDLLDHGEDARRAFVAGVGPQRGAEVLQEEHGGGLGRFVGFLPEPACRVGAEDLLHGVAEHGCVEGPAGGDLGKHDLGSGEECGSAVSGVLRVGSGEGESRAGEGRGVVECEHASGPDRSIGSRADWPPGIGRFGWTPLYLTQARGIRRRERGSAAGRWRRRGLGRRRDRPSCRTCGSAPPW